MYLICLVNNFIMSRRSKRLASAHFDISFSPRDIDDHLKNLEVWVRETKTLRRELKKQKNEFSNLLRTARMLETEAIHEREKLQEARTTNRDLRKYIEDSEDRAGEQDFQIQKEASLMSKENEDLKREKSKLQRKNRASRNRIKKLRARIEQLMNRQAPADIKKEED